MSTIFKRYPILIGMTSYSLIWPSASIVQQKIGGEEKLDWKKAARFGIFGAFFIAPSLYGWIRVSSRMFPQTNFITGVKKAVIEQFSYGPTACASFFYGMCLLEGGSHEQAVQEVKDKFFNTWKVGVCVWPVLQTVNFSLVKERYRVLFVSVCSFMWTTFLAYMKQKEKPAHETEQQLSVQN